MSATGQSHWVFGYGSLIWLPGFRFRQRQQALLRGAHRSLCIYSHRHRGTPQAPGLVFGLTRGGSCNGMAFEVAAEDWPETRDYLREREQVSGVYREAMRSVRLADGQAVEALVFLVDPGHAQYAGRLDVTEQLRLVRRSHGRSGPNRDYVINTARHLEDLGVADAYLSALARLLEAEG
ncbi:gamma-glutamylcyclotransferase [Arsenicitalea aurantiaca]|uniref:gamma-glutamylcyclotransferase n=1 Tax=Arsenicitalea aurantiaca TaxID=1783274 RepID=UPI001FCEE832|nr:gamma-glutamylcyclotransferase [Arsenicitalea aurantiaca]